MDTSQTLHFMKRRVFRELRNKRWQSYVVAVGMVLGFFLVVQSGLGESPQAPVTSPKEKQVAAATQDPPIKGYQLKDETHDQVPDEPAMTGPPPSAVEPSETEVEGATRVTQDFYAALSEGRVAQAYDLLSSDFQYALPYGVFSEGYLYVEAMSCEVKHSELVDNDRVRLDLQIQVTENGCPGTYYVTCLVSREQEWRISGMMQLEG